MLTKVKNRPFVVMTKTDYKQKMDNLLNDTTTYRRIKTDPTNKIQTKNNYIANILYKTMALFFLWINQQKQ